MPDIRFHCRNDLNTERKPKKQCKELVVQQKLLLETFESSGLFSEQINSFSQ